MNSRTLSICSHAARVNPRAIVIATVAGAATLAALMANVAHAADEARGTYPEKPVRFVVGQAPGGATDIVARLVASKLTEALGQNVIVENRTGAAGSIAADAVAKAAPDGYTLLVVSSSFSINPALYSSLPFDPQKDLLAVSLLAEAPFLLVVHPAVPAANVKALIALAKARPETLTYGSGGNGSSGHLASALLANMTGVKFVHVPYKGTGPALVDVVAGQISFMMASVLSSLHYVQQGRLRALGVTGIKRSPALPQLPTIAESGVPGYSTGTWYGILAPAGTRPPIVDRLAAAASKVMSGAELRDRLSADGAEPLGTSPSVFQKHLAAEIQKWRGVVKSTGIAVD